MQGEDRDSPSVNGPSVGRINTSSIAAALQRSASLNTGFPTRTLRITASEQSSRDNTPNPISIEDLTNRPRSNPRLRTPMRYESPLESDAFRITSPSFAREGSSRITIRPSGTTVGSVPRRQVSHDHEVVKSKSSKQGPSQRKIRRWKNENFAGLAAELSKSSSQGAVAADVLLKAQRDAHLYRSIYDPMDHRRSEKVNRFMMGDEMKDVREQFFEGHGPVVATPGGGKSGSIKRTALSGDAMLHRIDQRLRRLVVRACHNSYAAAKVVQLFETFVVSSFTGKSDVLREDPWWSDLLLESPTVTRRNDNLNTAQFFFDSTLPTAGFHRLLLHAVCQFHGLNVVSQMETNCVFQNKATSARILVATGQIDDASANVLLLQYLGEDIDGPFCIDSPTAIADKMAGLRVADKSAKQTIHI